MARSSEVNQGKVAAVLTRGHNNRILGICDVKWAVCSAAQYVEELTDLLL